MELEAKKYSPTFRKKRVVRKTSPSVRLKNRIKYRKNKYKIKMYNRKYRLKNKNKLKLRNKLRKYRRTW